MTRFALVLVSLTLWAITASAASSDPYSIGTPTLTTLYVDPAATSSGNGSAAQPFKTVRAAWAQIPDNEVLTTGYKIMLAPGTYGEEELPNYWELKRGTLNAPIWLTRGDGSGTVRFTRDVNIANVSYVYLSEIEIKPANRADAFHCEGCDHLLLRNMRFISDRSEAHETLKINQSQYVYIENSDIHGADDNAVDFVAVQYGHVINNRIHDAVDWCMYAKGGSSHLIIAQNEFYDCGTGGFTAGQGTGFEFMSSPFLYYEATHLKVFNNVIHDTIGAGLGVNGGYNILLAYNTLYKIGSRSHSLEVVFGARSCDGDTGACSSRQASGGWGPGETDVSVPIPNRNVYVFNNVIWNPMPFRSADQIFAIYGPQVPQDGTNVPNPAMTDENLRIHGNVVWNGPTILPLGIEDSEQGCQPGNSTCTLSQLNSENQINSLEPALATDYRPQFSGAFVESIPDFPADGGWLSALPTGDLSNEVSQDRGGVARAGSDLPGAYAAQASPVGGYSAPSWADVEPPVTSVTFSRITSSPTVIRRRHTIRLRVSATPTSRISTLRFMNGTRRLCSAGRPTGTRFECRYTPSARGSLRVTALVALVGGGTTRSSQTRLTVR